jgi:hypothetical protein
MIDRDGVAFADCDCLATLAAALLARMGQTPVFIVAGRSETGRFEHVLYGVLRKDGSVLPIDSQHRFFGELPPQARRSFVYRFVR